MCHTHDLSSVARSRGGPSLLVRAASANPKTCSPVGGGESCTRHSPSRGGAGGPRGGWGAYPHPCSTLLLIFDLRALVTWGKGPQLDFGSHCAASAWRAHHVHGTPMGTLYSKAQLPSAPWKDKHFRLLSPQTSHTPEVPGPQRGTILQACTPMHCYPVTVPTPRIHTPLDAPFCARPFPHESRDTNWAIPYPNKVLCPLAIIHY